MAGEYEDEESGGYGGGYAGPPGLAVMGMSEQFTTPEALEYAKKILGRTVDGPDPLEGQDYLSKVKANAETARNALKRAREKLAAQEYGRGEEWLAAAAGFGSPTKTGSFGETIGNVAGNLIEPRRKRREFNVGRDKDLMNIDLGLAGVDDQVLKAQLELMKLQQDRDTRMSTEALKILGRRVGAQQEIPKRAREAVDREYAKDYVEFIQTGASDAAKALEELGGARDQLRGYAVNPDGTRKKLKKNDSLTGPVVGTLSNLPWVGKTVQDVAFPESSDVQETVEYTVQRSLRPILGSQFTKEEGERLIARVYNPRLDEATNAERLDRLIKQLDRAYKAKIAAAKYFEANNTLNGFRGKVNWSIDDFLPQDDAGGDEAPADEEAPARGYLPPVKELPELDYEDIVPAGEDLAEGGVVEYAEGGEVDDDRVPHQMPDGRIIRAPAGVPYDRVLQRYEQAVGQSFARQPEDAAAAEEGAQEPGATDAGEMDFDAPTAIELGGSAVGHGLLGAAGGRYGMKTAHALADLMPGHKVSNAESRVLRGLETEGLNPSEWTKLVLQAQRMGVPVTGMDMGGVELRALGEAAMNPENPETRQIYQETRDRQAGARGRVEERVNQSLKPDEYFDTMRKLKTDLQKNAKPVYDELYQKYPSLKSETLMQLMDTPSGKKAVKAAAKSIRDRPGATLGKTDATGMITKPSLEFLDQVKQELDDMIMKEEGTGGNYQATGRGKRLRSLRNALRNEMDTLTTDPKTKESAYKAARSQYSGDIEVMDALRLGREDFNKMPPKELEPLIKDMSFAEKDALRTGVAQKLYEQIRAGSSRVNPAAKIIDSPDAVERLRLIFDKPNEFKIFKEALELESRLFEESKSTISRGKSKLTSTLDPKTNVLKRTAKEAPTLGIFQPVQWVLRYFRRQPSIGKKESAEILQILKEGNPAKLKALEARLAPKVGRAAARKGRVGKAAIAGAAIGASLPFVKKYFGDEEEPVDEEQEFARGGLVRRRPTWERVTERVLNQSMFGGDDILSALSDRME
jgi:hypothetical protein